MLNVRSKMRKKYINENILGYVCVLPVIIFISLFIAYPIVASLVLSFFKWKGYGPLKFIGLNNFITMFTADKYFYTALKNSLIFAIGSTIGSVIIGFVLAVLIDLKIRFWKIYRFVFFLSVVISIPITGMLWLRMLDPYGLLNSLLDVLHLDKFKYVWLGDGRTALIAIVSASIWQFSGFPMIFFLAGLQSISEEIYEAAKIDGASTIRRIFSITIPLLKHVFSVIIMLQMIFSFKVFDIVWVLTKGGPARATEVLGTHLYIDAFRNYSFGYASVISVVMFLVAFILSIIYIKSSGYYESVKRTI
jgi:ABC-type sugar transport system permease subunit